MQMGSCIQCAHPVPTGYVCATTGMAAAAISAWVVARKKYVWLEIKDQDVTTLPPLPADVLWLHLFNCTNLRRLPPLPAGLEALVCTGCTVLRRLPALPASLRYFYCYNCPALHALPPLPTALTDLGVTLCPSARDTQLLLPTCLVQLKCDHSSVAIPDTCPAQLRTFNSLWEAESRRQWRQFLQRQHARERCLAATSLPFAALLYV
jgi:hypothetical protein